MNHSIHPKFHSLPEEVGRDLADDGGGGGKVEGLDEGLPRPGHRLEVGEGGGSRAQRGEQLVLHRAHVLGTLEAIV